MESTSFRAPVDAFSGREIHRGRFVAAPPLPQADWSQPLWRNRVPEHVKPGSHSVQDVDNLIMCPDSFAINQRKYLIRTEVCGCILEADIMFDFIIKFYQHSVMGNRIFIMAGEYISVIFLSMVGHIDYHVQYCTGTRAFLHFIPVARNILVLIKNTPL